MPHVHTVSVDPKSHLVYFPLENVGGRPLLRIMKPADLPWPTCNSPLGWQAQFSVWTQRPRNPGRHMSDKRACRTLAARGNAQSVLVVASVLVGAYLGYIAALLFSPSPLAEVHSRIDFASKSATSSSTDQTWFAIPLPLFSFSSPEHSRRPTKESWRLAC